MHTSEKEHPKSKEQQAQGLISQEHVWALKEQWEAANESSVNRE